jgi:hypothetical protein
MAAGAVSSVFGTTMESQSMPTLTLCITSYYQSTSPCAPEPTDTLDSMMDLVDDEPSR